MTQSWFSRAQTLATQMAKSEEVELRETGCIILMNLTCCNGAAYEGLELVVQNVVPLARHDLQSKSCFTIISRAIVNLSNVASQRPRMITRVAACCVKLVTTEIEEVISNVILILLNLSEAKESFE